jgi:ABC-type Co2+ transport system permease subunit
MGSFLIKVGQPLRRRVWYAVRGVIDIFHLLPIVASGIVFWLLWQAGQVRELYISYLEHLNWQHVVFAFVGMGLLSAAIYASHYGLTEIRRNIIYARYVRPNIGISFRRMRRGTAWILALLPWLGMALGLERAREYRFADWMQQLVPDGGPSNWMFVGAIGAVVAAGLLTVALLDLFRHSHRSVWAFAALVAAIFVLAAVTPVAPWDVVQLYRALGPFATLSIGILFVFHFVRSLRCSRRNRNFRP